MARKYQREDKNEPCALVKNHFVDSYWGFNAFKPLPCPRSCHVKTKSSDLAASLVLFRTAADPCDQIYEKWGEANASCTIPKSSPFSMDFFLNITRKTLSLWQRSTTFHPPVGGWIHGTADPQWLLRSMGHLTEWGHRWKCTNYCASISRKFTRHSELLGSTRCKYERGKASPVMSCNVCLNARIIRRKHLVAPSTDP